jgi:hypothetical protein
MKRSTLIYPMVFIMIALLVLPCGCNNESTSNDNYPPLPSVTLPIPSSELMDASALYNNDDYKFSVSYCKEMKVQENAGAAVVFLGDMLGDMAHFISISVVVKKLPAKTTLRDYMEQNKQAAEETLQDYKSISEEETTVAGLPAVTVMYNFFTTLGEHNYMFKNTMTTFVKGKNVYSIIYAVPTDFYSQYIDCYNLILYTFAFD